MKHTIVTYCELSSGKGHQNSSGTFRGLYRKIKKEDDETKKRRVSFPFRVTRSDVDAFYLAGSMSICTFCAHILRNRCTQFSSSRDYVQLSKRRSHDLQFRFVENVLDNLLSSTDVDGRCLIVALMYYEEAIQALTQVSFNSENYLPLLCTCLMLSSKFFEDQYMQNIEWCHLMPLQAIRMSHKKLDLSLSDVIQARQEYRLYHQIHMDSKCLFEKNFSYSLHVLNTFERMVLKVLNYRLMKTENQMNEYVFKKLLHI